MRNIVYTESFEGARTEDQALKIRKYFDEFLCDYLVLDAQGVGAGVYDALSRDITDPDTGEIYPALSCCNNAEMAARCVNPNAKKVVEAALKHRTVILRNYEELQDSNKKLKAKHNEDLRYIKELEKHYKALGGDLVCVKDSLGRL